MSDFWTRALGTESTPAVSAVLPPTYVSQVPVPYGSVPSPVTNTKARSSYSTARCPECASGNYAAGANGSVARCYDCGHNSRFGAQTGAGGLPAGHGVPATPARQVSTTSNYQPTTVIGRIDA